MEPAADFEGAGGQEFDEFGEDGGSPAIVGDTTLTVPKGSVKRVVKLDKDVKMVAADAVFLMTKATVRELRERELPRFSCWVSFVSSQSPPGPARCCSFLNIIASPSITVLTYIPSPRSYRLLGVLVSLCLVPCPCLSPTVPRSKRERCRPQEMFVATFANAAYESTLNSNRKIMSYKDVYDAVQSGPKRGLDLEFLEGIIPDEHHPN